MDDKEFDSDQDKKTKKAGSVLLPDDNFQEVCSILDGAEGFGGALWDAGMRAAFDAKGKCRQAADPEKGKVFQECVHNLRESMVAEIERWAPKYVELAAAYPQFTGPSPTEWARERMQEQIEVRLQQPDLDGAVAFFFITTAGGDVTANDRWLPPRWICSPREMLVTIRHEHNGVARRLEYALNKILARLKVGIVIKRGEQSERRDAVINAAANHSQLPQAKEGGTSEGKHGGRKPSPDVAAKNKCIQTITATGVKGSAYCEQMDLRRWPTKRDWQTRWECPKKYLEAWHYPDEDKLKRFRQLISDEKSKAARQKRN